MSEFKVVECFISINGEGRKAGQLAVFVRFAGCNLACSYCDTMWANAPDVKYNLMSAEEILSLILKTGIKNVTLTGGEPLLQKDIGELLDLLAERKELSVEIETNGSVPIGPFQNIENAPSMTMDYKLPSSGSEGAMCLENMEQLKEKDTVKFVCGSHADLDRAVQVINEFDLTKRCKVYLSPVFGAIEPADIVEYMKEFRLNDVNLQLQLHKFIWDPNKRGV